MILLFGFIKTKHKKNTRYVTELYFFYVYSHYLIHWNNRIFV